MPIPSSGPLSLTDIQTEFGGTNPISLNEYYAGGGLVPSGTTGTYGAVPTSGQISIQNFYGTSNVYAINNSLRFRSSASAYLSRTPASAGSQTTWTWSGWIKRGTLGTVSRFLTAGSGSTDAFGFLSGDTFQFFTDSTGQNLITTQVFRDPSAWYHFVIVNDTTQATSSNRVKIYVNGSQITAFGTATYPAQNSTGTINSATAHNIGRRLQTASEYFDGYMAEVNFINGQALTPSSFGQTSTTTGSWIPKAYTGTYGTNGYYLKFSNIALTSGSNTGLGQDFSGNGNFWNTNNMSVTAGITYDAMTDSPTPVSATVGNYCTGNPLDVSVRGSFSNANLTATCTGGGSLQGGSVRLNTFNFTQLPVKWYWESTVTNSGNGRAGFGMITNSFIAQNENWSATGGWFLRADGVQSNLTNPGSFTTNDVMMFAYDGNTGRVWIGKNGTWTNSGVPASGTGQNATLIVGTEYWLLFNENTGGADTAVCAMNFGQRPFAYTPPSGFVRVNTFNIPTSTIVKGNSYMDATLYTGTGANATITNAGSFRPDLVWVKVRSTTGTHVLTDSNRGANRQLFSNLLNAEATSTIKITGFTSTGFTLGADNGTGTGDANFNGSTFVGWQWQAGQGTNTTNTAGSITSTVSVNTTAGFSIVTYTANGVNGATVGHGLGVAPRMIIIKDRSNASFDWSVYHSSLGATSYIFLNRTDASAVSATFWNNTAPSSTVITLGNTGFVNNNGSNLVAYCWAQIEGFSAFGSYTGNGSADGTFVYLGFRPAYLLIKRAAGGTEDWFTFDNKRIGYNADNNYVYPDANFVEGTLDYIDILSNGFKSRSTSTSTNASGSTYIYAAFAENPFKNANAR